MGPQRIFQAAAAVVLGAAGVAAAAPKEKVAVVDLGPSDPAVRAQLADVLTAAGLDPVATDALAGESADRDADELVAALALAQTQFGKLDCKQAIEASTRAIGLASQRQAAGLPAPELARAWTYVLLCADRGSETDRAMTAAARLREAGGSTDVPAEVWKKYPELDTVADRELVPLEITADVANAEIWIDGKRAGLAPVTVLLPIGEHVIAAAAGSRRGWAAGNAVAAQTKLVIPTQEQSGSGAEVANRIASWKGAVPSPQELGWLMAKLHVRVALVRRGDTIEAFGRIGIAEAPKRMGEGGDGVGTINDAKRIAALVVDRVQAWNDRAPDPDRPLLLDDRTKDGKRRDQPTKWWVYASIVGAIVVGGAVIYANDAGTDRQRIQVTFP